MSNTVNEPCINDTTTGTKAGDTTFVSGYLRLSTATNFSSGRFNYSANLQQSIDMRCDFWAGGGSGADACFFYWGASGDQLQEDTNTSSYTIALDEFQDQYQILFAGTVLTTSAITTLDNSTWRSVHLRVSGQTIKLWVDGVNIFNFQDTTIRALGGTTFGWGGRCGGTNNEHRVRNMLLSSPLTYIVGSNIKPHLFGPGIAR